MDCPNANLALCLPALNLVLRKPSHKQLQLQTRSARNSAFYGKKTELISRGADVKSVNRAFAYPRNDNALMQHPLLRKKCSSSFDRPK